MNTQNLCLNCFAERRPDAPCGHCGWRGKANADVDGQLAPGSVLQNRYVIGLPLGRGGFSITYRGWDTRLQRLRAVKEYFPAGVVTREGSQSRVSIVSGQSGLYSDGIQKYLAEARVLARFEGHPCIVFPTDFFEENATAYLVMEYLEGETLRQYVTRNGGRIPYEHAVYYLTPVLRALATVHEAGMLHRDVSPDNVFLTVDNETKLLDFGAARQRMGGQSAAMTVIIRDHYAPPEQYSETGKQGTWTDIYAFAATFYYALTGESPPSALARLMSDDIRRPSELGASVPLAAEAMLMRALSIQPKDRPQQIDDVLHPLIAPPQPIVAQVEPPPADPTRITGVAPPDESAAVQLPPVQAAPGDVEVRTPIEAPASEPPSEPRTATRPSRAREDVRVATAGVVRRLLDTAREEQWWRWPVFALVAAGVAFATFAVLERLSPSRPDDVPSVAAPRVPVVQPVLVPDAPSGAPEGDEASGAPTEDVVSDPPALPRVVTPGGNAALGGTAPPGATSDTPTPADTAAPEPGAPTSPTPGQRKPPPAPVAKPVSPPAQSPSAAPTAPAPPREELAGVFAEGRDLVRSTKRADRKRGYELVVYAAEGGLPAAELLLGSLCVAGIPGVQRPDEAAALKWYRAAAKHGDVQARFDLARRLELGMWEKKVEYVEECAWWVPFCKADLPEAQVRAEVDPEKDLLAWMRSQTPARGTPAELKEALGLYRGLAEQGNTDAQERIGFMLVAGNGIEADRSEAFLWFLKAARKGDASAQYVVGKMYAKGEGIAPNDEAAVCWLRKAAAEKVPPARRALVAMGKAKPTGELDPAPRECRFKAFDE